MFAVEDINCVLLRFSDFAYKEIYIQDVYFQQRSKTHAYFQIQYIRVNISNEYILYF